MSESHSETRVLEYPFSTPFRNAKGYLRVLGGGRAGRVWRRRRLAPPADPLGAEGFVRPLHGVDLALCLDDASTHVGPVMMVRKRTRVTTCLFVPAASMPQTCALFSYQDYRTRMFVPGYSCQDIRTRTITWREKRGWGLDEPALVVVAAAQLIDKRAPVVAAVVLEPHAGLQQTEHGVLRWPNF